MLFNSLDFLIFFPLVTILYFLLPHKFRWLHLLIASCIFYCAFVPVYIFILFFTIIIDYFAGIMIERSEGIKRKRYLIMSLIANIGVLAIFKYYNFFIDNANDLLALLNISTGAPLPYLSILLPIGLSFHTFQAMSYTVEVYNGNQKAEKHFGIYSLYVMFYPQLVAGPIERPQNVLHQFHEVHYFNQANLYSGLRLMLWGFFKKLVIADRLSTYVTIIYDRPDDFHAGNLIIAALFFGIQIYCDFSGYSDIALGSAKTMGFDLMTNFNRPFFSKNITEFWRRWHISLSTWFNDYLYMPIALAKRDWGTYGIIYAILITFLLSGLWHGAAWTFVIYGLIHGLALSFEILTKKQRKKYSKKIPPLLYNNISILLTFLFVCFSWIFFRATSFKNASLICKNIITFNSTESFSAVVASPQGLMFGWTSTIIIAASTAFMFLIELLTPPDLSNLDERPAIDILLSSVTLSCIIIVGVFHNTSFIYFQF